MPIAACINDPIQHSNALMGLLVGAAAGLVIAAGAVALGVATGGVGFFVGAALFGSAFGELVGGMSFMGGTITGAIVTGPPNVSYSNKLAARASLDFVDCAGTPPIYLIAHPHKPVAQGSATVLINGSPAARVGDKIKCSSKIESSTTHVEIGGGTVTTEELEDEVPGIIRGIQAAAAVIVVGPVRFVFGLVFGTGGAWVGQQTAIAFGLNEDFQRLFAFAGGFAASYYGDKYGGQRAANWIGNKFGGPFGGFLRGGYPGMRQASQLSTGGAAAKKANAPVEKFSDYIFKEGADHGKDAPFRSLGYGKKDSPYLAELWEQQALGKFSNGDYTLGKLDQYGQRITIEIELHGIGAATGKTSYMKSGWMLNPDGTISLNTPFSGFTK